MKLGSYPPLIIFFDLLFVFLFLFILNTNKVVEIELPEGKLIAGAEIVIYDDREDKYFTLGENVYIAKSSYTYLDKCDSSITECRTAFRQYNNAFIVYPKKLQREISDLVLLALGTGVCKKIYVKVKENGKIDHESNLLYNPCFKKLNGYENFIKKSI